MEGEEEAFFTWSNLDGRFEFGLFSPTTGTEVSSMAAHHFSFLIVPANFIGRSEA
jgi:hypothetical protein